MMKGFLYLEDGSVFTGSAIGSNGTRLGELVFNTSMTGYEEILTDPSYTGQVVLLTYPLIGNYGVEPAVAQSESVKGAGLIVGCGAHEPAFTDYLKRHGVVAIDGVDTRQMARHIRKNGAMKCLLTTETLTLSEVAAYFEKPLGNRLAMKSAGTKQLYRIEGAGARVAVMDFGIKSNLLNALTDRGCDVYVCPYDMTYDEIVALEPDGIFLSNGPGDPACAEEAVETIQRLSERYPIFGICMGHQLLASALGAETYKLHFGHRGANHGVLDLRRKRTVITSQNHGYAVRIPETLKTLLEVTHVNLNDGTVEGIRHKEKPLFSVQYHPEGAPGPNDSKQLFDDFIQLCEKGGASCH
ncbi:glutamine-hydrolyzing carbamoyl-phosphate synthase small subunit [Fusibacter sp. JL298sf-3]